MYTSFFSTESKLKFSRNSILVFQSFIRLSIHVTSKSVSPVHSVTISQTKSILGSGTAVKSIPFGAISSRADAKPINDNGFLSDLANELNFFLWTSYKGSFLFIMLCSISFLHDSHLLSELVHDGFVKPVRTAASTRNIAAANDNTFHPCLLYKCIDMT